MALYIRLRNVFAISLEWDYNYGHSPFLSIQACHGETIIDVPYAQIILTPGRILKAEQLGGNNNLVNTHNETNR